MSLLNIDTTDTEELLKKKSYDPIPKGKYVCEIGNDLKVEQAKSSANSIVKIELVVTDDGEYKGRKIFDNLVIGATPEVAAKTQWKIAQFAVACGVCTKETLDNIDLDAFKGCTVEVEIGVKTETYNNETKAKNFVKQYLFDVDAASA